MTDLRELVARTLVAGYGGDHDYWQEPDETDRLVADAVLAALTKAGALLPDWPKGFNQITFYRATGGDQEVTAHIGPFSIVEFSGKGPTLAAALADAIKESKS